LLSTGLATEAAAPAGHFTVSNGTVYDTRTKLTWVQTPTTATFAWSAAITYCSTLSLNGTGWRLPTVKELNSLVDYSVSSPGPLIDATAFPGAPAVLFWSSSAATSTLGSAWIVDFQSGYAQPYGPPSTPNRARCVR
jgi:hypothetical protein